MIDRAARDRAAGLIEKFLMGEIGAFELDEKLSAIDTKDETVRHVVFSMWFTYDDLIDHRVNLTGEGWNYAERLRLLLLSEATMVREGPRPWASTALRLGLAAGMVALIFGIRWSLPGSGFWIAYGAAGVATVAVLLRRSWHAAAEVQAKRRADGWGRMPFESFAQLRAVRRSVGNFRKLPAPRVREARPLRPRWKETLMMIPWIGAWPLMVAITVPLGRGARDVVKFEKGQAGIAGTA